MVTKSNIHFKLSCYQSQ